MKPAVFHPAAILIDRLPLRAADPLETGFAKPAEETKPWGYWYWLDNNISRDGITRNLAAMSRVGIGVARRAEWWGMIEHAIRKGGRLGVEATEQEIPVDATRYLHRGAGRDTPTVFRQVAGAAR